MMTKEEMIDHLSSLVKLDADAVRAYSQALEEIDIDTIKDRMTQFRDDHQRHVDEARGLIADLGGLAPAETKNISGFAVEGFTAVRSRGGAEAALQAMQTNENQSHKFYDAAIRWDLTSGPLALVKRNLQDEKMHLQYIQEALAERAWEQPHWQPRVGREFRPEERPGAPGSI